MTMNVPKVIQGFHLPSPVGSYVAGQLNISGMLAVVFPKSPAYVVVRTRPLSGDRVDWLRNFGGRTFVPSIYSRSSGFKLSTEEEVPLHDVESVFPFNFQFDWKHTSNSITPKLVRTTLLNLVPIPKWLVSLDLELSPHADLLGWDLKFQVTSLWGRLVALGYDGSLRTVERSTNHVPGFHHLVLYDGHCNLCNASVDFLMKFDTQARFIFCSQSDPQAHDILKAHGYEPPAELAEGGEDGSVLVLTADGELIDRAHAPLYALKFLGFPFNVIGQLGLAVPRTLSDYVYNAIAKRRYAIFGRKSTCRVPTKEERDRFLHRMTKT